VARAPSVRSPSWPHRRPRHTRKRYHRSRTLAANHPWLLNLSRHSLESLELSTNIVELLAGSLGFFWLEGATPKHQADGQPGYIRLTDDGFLQIETLEKDFLEHARRYSTPPPQWISGKTQFGGIVLLNLTGRSSSVNIGGSKSSVSTYRGLTLIAGVDAEAIDAPKALNASAFIPDISEWAGLTSVVVEPTLDEQNRSKEVRVNVLPCPSRSATFRGRGIQLSTHWETSGSASRKTIYAPLQVTCTSKRARPITDLLQPLFRVQDLINLAYQGFVASDGGRAQLRQGCDGRNPRLWNGTLMHVPAGASPPGSVDENPLFWLDDLGGMDGLTRWLELCHRHPRAVYPLTERFRLGPIAPETRLMQIGAAIECWTAANARSAKWPKVKPQSLAVARRGGSDFSEWVGNRHAKWADEFWSEYLAVKHLTKRKPDPYLCRLLAESGSVLLTCVLLKRVAGGSNAVVKRILSSHRLHNLGRAVRDAI
jgi:hypothetical protein